MILYIKPIISINKQFNIGSFLDSEGYHWDFCSSHSSLLAISAFGSIPPNAPYSLRRIESLSDTTSFRHMPFCHMPIRHSRFAIWASSPYDDDNDFIANLTCALVNLTLQGYDKRTSARAHALVIWQIGSYGKSAYGESAYGETSYSQSVCLLFICMCVRMNLLEGKQFRASCNMIFKLILLVGQFSARDDLWMWNLIEAARLAGLFI